MGLRINTNIEAFNAHRNLMATSSALSLSMQRLSSGLRINSAADDPAGLGISERMRAQISGLTVAQRNAQDGISMVQTAEGSLQEFTSILHRVRDLAVQYNNGVYSTADKAAITAEVGQLNAELTRMIGATNFNGIALLSSGGAMLATLQVGANSGDIITISGIDATGTLGTVVSDFATVAAGGTVSISAIDTVIDGVSSLRSTLGATQNQLEHTVNFLSVYQENLQSAESRVRDVDVAAEMTNFTRLQILQQSGIAMLAQANLASQSMLALLR